MNRGLTPIPLYEYACLIPHGWKAISITSDVKDFALGIGYSKVGITSADDFQDHIDEVQS
jgi:hypothetical protein